MLFCDDFLLLVDDLLLAIVGSLLRIFALFNLCCSLLSMAELLPGLDEWASRNMPLVLRLIFSGSTELKMPCVFIH